MKFKISILIFFIIPILIYSNQVDIELVKELASNPNLILLRGNYFDPLIEIKNDLEFGLSTYEKNLLEDGLYIVQFFNSPKKEDREIIKNSGANILYYVPNNAFLIRAKEDIGLNLNQKVRSFFKLPKWAKIYPELFNFQGEEINIQIMSTPDRDAIRIAEKISDLFPKVYILTDYEQHKKGRLICKVLREELLKFLDEISAFEEVLSIDPWIKPEMANDNSIWVGQAYDTSGRSTPIWNRGITGTGQVVAVMDSGLDTDMCYFRYNSNPSSKTIAQFITPPDVGTIDMSKKVIAYYVLPRSDPYDCSDLLSRFHGTHVAGSVAGDNFATPSTPNSGGHDLGDGMAPNAKILFQDVGDVNCDLSGIWGDMNDTYLQAKNAGAFIHNNSWSVPINAYTSDSYDMDEFTYRNEDFLFIVAMGNRGSGVGDGSIGAPATAKNVVSVGATTNGGDPSLANNLMGFSGRGPTSDGRLKPDITAPGRVINSAYGSWSNNDNNCASWTKDGTSMATPTISGFTALLRQYFIDGWYPSGTKVSADSRKPSAALMKACLLNGAMPMTGTDQNGGNPITPIPSMDQGWGRIHLENVLYFSGDSRRLRVWDVPNFEGISTGEQRQYFINVISSSQPLKVHLAWTDPESLTLAGINLVNNLDLEVISPSGTTYKGNVFSGGVSVPGGNADLLNNIEGVYIPSPETGIWTLRVKGASIPGTGVAPGSEKQGYALVATFPTCSSSLSAPQNLSAQDNGSTGIDLSWNPVSGATSYLIYRAKGSSPSPEDYFLIGTTTSTSYTDTNAEGGYTYSYKVRAQDNCSESPSSSPASATASGACSIPPSFEGLKNASNDFLTPVCDIDLSWGDGTSNCPYGPNIKYNIYRGTTPYFTISSQNLIASGIIEKSYKDTNVLPLKTYYYLVKAEDSTNSGGGPSNNGNLDKNLVILKETTMSNSLSQGNWFDDGGDTNAKLIIEGSWAVTNQQNRTPGGSFSYHNAPDSSTYRGGECNIIKTPKILLKAPPSNPILSYYVKYNMESSCDGVVVEISEDGENWERIAPTSGYPGASGCYPLGCDYSKGTQCFTGNSMSSWTQYSHSLSSYAGKEVQIRWVSFSDQAIEREGFYLDDILITDAYVNDPCGSSNGRIFFDRNAYGCNNTIGISLGDYDLRGQGNIQVSIQSSTETTPETVTLTESPSGSGNFYGSIQTTNQPPPSPGKLSITNGDTITVSYNDTGYGTKTDTAYGDCVIPSISNIQVTSISYDSATITWNTSENTEGLIYYNNSFPLNKTKSDKNFTTNHLVKLTDLSPCTTYFFYVASIDAGGNLVIDNNNGNYFSFTTKPYNLATFTSTDTPKDIPDGPPGVISTISITEDKIIEDINIKVNVLHYDVSQISITLISPSGVEFDLASYNNAVMGSFKDTVFDEEATQLITRAIPPYVGSFKPEVSLAPLYGTSTLGNWQLKVLDNVTNVQFGYIYSWSLEFKYALNSCNAEVRNNSLNYTETCTGTGSGGGNGYIDPGETANLTIKLQNKGNQVATNVRAVLSSPTTGVTVVGNTAFYPNIPEGSAKQNSSPFVVYFSSSITCGTTVNFNLNIYTDQGNWTDTFQLNIGRISYTNLMSQNWDSSKPPNLPTGWTKVDVSGTTGDWVSVSNSTDPPPVSPSIIMQYAANGNDGDSTRLYYNTAFNLSSYSKARVTVWVYGDTSLMGIDDDYLQVQVSTSGAGGPWNNVGAPIYRKGRYSGWLNHTIDLSSYSGYSSVMVGFLGVTDYNSEWARNLFIDDVVVSGGNWACSNCTSTPPPCNNPSGLPNNTATDLDPCTSGILISWAKDPSSWGDSGGTRSYDVLRDGIPIQIALPYGTTSWTDTSASPGTNYLYSVRYNNGCGKSATTTGVYASDTVNAPGQPVITNIVDNNTLVQDGIRVYYNPGQGATSHNLIKDGSTAVVGYSSGSLYDPQDTLEHTYKIRAIKGSCSTDSLPQNFTDEANQCTPPSQPSIQTITDTSGNCAYGISISFTPGSPSTRHDLYVDSTLKLTNISNPVSYNPNDSNSHSYVIRAINGSSSCYTDSSPSNFSDTNNTTIPTIQGPSSNNCPSNGVLLSTESGMSNYQWYLGGNPINGANSYQYFATSSGTYTVSYTNQYSCNGTSAEKNVTIVPCVPNIIYLSRGNFVEITGDGDSNFERGEKWSVQINLKNIGTLDATNVRATLEGNGITVCAPSKSFGNIPINETGSANFDFVIDTDFSPCGGIVNFNVINKYCNEANPAGPNEYNLFNLTVGQQVPQTVNLFGPDDLPNLNNWIATNYQLASTNTCSGHSASDAQSTANGATLRILNPVSTVGYTNITVQYDWRVTNSSATQYLEWSANGTDWNTVDSTNSTSWSCNQTKVLPSGAENQSTLYIRFRTTTTQAQRRGEVDYIKISGDTLVWDCSYIGNGNCPQCTPPTQNIQVFLNSGILSWNQTDAENYRVLRGIQTDLPNLLNNQPDFDCYAYGSFTSIDISGDDPSGVPGKCFYYLVQGYNSSDPDNCLGPPGNSSSGSRQIETKNPCD